VGGGCPCWVVGGRFVGGARYLYVSLPYLSSLLCRVGEWCGMIAGLLLIVMNEGCASEDMWKDNDVAPTETASERWKSTMTAVVDHGVERGLIRKCSNTLSVETWGGRGKWMRAVFFSLDRHWSCLFTCISPLTVVDSSAPIFAKKRCIGVSPNPRDRRSSGRGNYRITHHRVYVGILRQQSPKCVPSATKRMEPRVMKFWWLISWRARVLQQLFLSLIRSWRNHLCAVNSLCAAN